MNAIKQIKLSKNEFTIFCDDFSLKLNCKTTPDEYIIDISAMNLINATKLAILCSTYCFIKNFKKKICWVVADEQIRRSIGVLRLKNIAKCLIADSNENRMGLAS